ncbi:hypothetical protein MVEN_00757200 [Mycena venus]|uniref:Uncharacterized protein n=1 Tax=Mycena venus TaxID=2733690 RepID=A0A8H7D321_9AGAR|nr:hypothetical protein MVEN_00757200 [Mycena venus]
MVFIHVLTECDDPTRPYSKHEYYYRPGFEFAGRIHTNLLLTCRLIYLETHLAPIALNEHVFWMRRGPPRSGISNNDNGHDAYFHKMTPQQRAASSGVGGARSAQADHCDSALRLVALGGPRASLRIAPPQQQWSAWIESIPQLEELELEFETIEPKKEQLEERVRVALGWKFPLKDGTTLVHNGEKPVQSLWAGTSRLAPGHGYGAWDADLRLQDEAALDRRFPLDLKMQVRKFKFVKESRLL